MVVWFTFDLSCLLGDLATAAMFLVLHCADVLFSSLEELLHVFFALLKLFFMELARSGIILVKTSIVL